MCNLHLIYYFKYRHMHRKYFINFYIFKLKCAIQNREFYEFYEQQKKYYVTLFTAGNR